MLNIEEFANYVQAHLSEVLPEELKDAKISVHEVQKNNGVVLYGITVTPEGVNISPNIYMESYFEQYVDGAELSKIMNRISSCVVAHIKAPKEYVSYAEEFQNFDAIKDKIAMVVVNAERNAELLAQVPHQKWEDLAFIHKVILGSNDEQTVSVIIRNEHMKYWGVDADQIHALAVKNAKYVLPAVVISMDTIIKDMLTQKGMGQLTDVMVSSLPVNQQMYVVTNITKMNGAAAMFYEGVLSNLAEHVGSDLYILPSSVHECIAISTNMCDPDALVEMVKEVNGTEVAIEEQLSDHVYKFDATSGKLFLVK